MAKKLGVQSAIARIRNPEFTAPDFIFSPQELGVDQFIHPEKETANAIVRLIRQSSATDLVEFAEGKLVLLGMRLDHQSSLLNAPLTELGRQLADIPMRIVAIQRKQQTLIPRGNTTLLPEDRIFVISDPDFIPAVTSLTGLADHRIEDIAILGGGLIGQFVAQELSSQMRVRLIESRTDRSRQIADQLANVLVIQGDGTDYDLLAVEGLADMDAFVAVTGNDEVNIISTLVAKHLEVPRAIALVNNVDYMPITPAIGLDSVLSKQLLTVNAVQRYVRHQRIASIASLPGLDVEAVEYIARGGSKITKKTSDLHPPTQGFDHRGRRPRRPRGHSAWRHAHPPQRQSRGLRPALRPRGSEKDLRGLNGNACAPQLHFGSLGVLLTLFSVTHVSARRRVPPLPRRHGNRLSVGLCHYARHRTRLLVAHAQAAHRVADPGRLFDNSLVLGRLGLVRLLPADAVRPA